MKKKSLRIMGWVAASPLILFLLLVVLLYVPPVQNLIRREAMRIASDATGMNIGVEGIHLHFPLDLRVDGVLVRDSLQRDTLLCLQQLRVRIQAWPLLKGRVEVDEVTLKEAEVDSRDLLPGMVLKGRLGHFLLESHGVDLVREELVLNTLSLRDTRMQVTLNDTTSTPPDTAATALTWNIALHQLHLQNVAVDVRMPSDSLRIAAQLKEMHVREVEADLKREAYRLQQLQIDSTSLAYDTGNLTQIDTLTLPAGHGLNPSHLHLKHLCMEVDSVSYCGHDVQAIIRRLTAQERSGFTISSLTGRLQSDSLRLEIPQLHLTTPHSEVQLQAHTYWQLLDIPTEGHLSTRLNAYIGKQDILLLAGDLPADFKEAYPFRPLTIRAGTEGNFRQMQISRFAIDLPGAFSLQGGGELWNLTDSLRRNGKVDFDLQTYNLNFLTALSGHAPQPSLVIPDSMRLTALLTLEASRLGALLSLNEGEGHAALDAKYDLATDAYRALMQIKGFRVDHFLPQDSIYGLTASAHLQGKGTNLKASRTEADLKLTLEELGYAQHHIHDVHLEAGLHHAVADASLRSNNDLLRGTAEVRLRTNTPHLDGTLHIDVAQLDLHRLGIAPQPLARPFAFGVKGEAGRDSVKVMLDAGDLTLRLKARSTLKELMGKGDVFMALLEKQIDERRLDHAALRRALPSARMTLQAGRENPVSYYLATQDIHYDDFRFSFGFSPRRGINGRTSVHGLRIDSLQLDTIFFRIAQDTTRMTLQGGVVNGPTNPQAVFRSTLTGEIRNEDAELSAHYVDGEGKTGVQFGINARPLTEGDGKGNGLLFQLTPEEPVIAFRTFHFADKANWVYLHKNMRVYANVDMDSDDGLCFRMQSNREDTVSLQNIHVELSRFRLSELSGILPYMPRLTGLFSAEAHYIQTTTSLQLSAEADVQQFSYEKQPVGDLAVGATWLPGDSASHYLSTYFAYNGEEILTADGILHTQGTRDRMDVTTRMEHFPLKIANAFVPDQMVTLSGDVDGEVSVTGYTDAPVMNGALQMDSVNLFARQVGASYWLDNRPVVLANNRLVFDKYAIYTTSKNPFTIDGHVDFRNLQNPTADLQLLAKSYTLLDAPRTRESLVYGKALVDIKAMLRGPLDALTMRGTMNLLGSTNLTYVLTDTPLTVEDRLDGLVTFTSFNDTISTDKEEAPTMSLGGLNMNMSLHIDDAVRLRADLSSDRSKYIELVGGGDLNLQYTPQGDVNLTGRYTLSGGTMKYSIPIIPLKEFTFTNGSYVDWRGDPMNPTLNLKATERIRASVSSEENNQASRMVNFDVSIAIKNRLEAPDLLFDLEAPEDATIQNELQSMGDDERSKQAITMLATGIYLNNNGRGGNLSMSSALNSVLQSQINSLAGGVRNASISVGIEDRTNSDTGDTQKDFSFRYSQRLFNDRVQIIIGGKVSTGAEAENSAESFIDNVSLEYRLDRSGTGYIRAFYNKNYESVLDGEITETGVGLVLRRKMDNLRELFLFRRKKDE